METVNFTGVSSGTDISIGEEQEAKVEDNNIAIQAASLLAYKIGMSIFTAAVIIIASKENKPLLRKKDIIIFFIIFQEIFWSGII